ncbi:hypothetical protein [Bradyrhizobium genosp. A]|uniref:hypothetical protein n=1 Tax=Bradyrhizobium genosp. A TaxID=83626 RepID=UPI003CF6D02E
MIDKVAEGRRYFDKNKAFIMQAGRYLRRHSRHVEDEALRRTKLLARRYPAGCSVGPRLANTAG